MRKRKERPANYEGKQMKRKRFSLKKYKIRVQEKIVISEFEILLCCKLFLKKREKKKPFHFSG